MTDPSELDVDVPDEAGDRLKGPVTLVGRLPIRELSQRLVEQARREILIFSEDLDPDYYDQAPFVEALRRLCLGAPPQCVRVLLGDPRAVALRGHRLIGLARQLTSRIAVRHLAEDFKDRPDAFLIADGRGYCVRRLADSAEAVADLNGARQGRLLRAEFEQMWERSDVDIELRRLFL